MTPEACSEYVRGPLAVSLAKDGYQITQTPPSAISITHRQLPSNVLTIAVVLVVGGLVAGAATGGHAPGGVIAFWAGVIIAAVVRERVAATFAVEDGPAEGPSSLRVAGYLRKRSQVPLERTLTPAENGSQDLAPTDEHRTSGV